MFVFQEVKVLLTWGWAKSQDLQLGDEYRNNGLNYALWWHVQ